MGNPITQVLAAGIVSIGATKNLYAISFYPGLLTSFWLWLYVGSGLLLKFARRFDKLFQWFNSKADIGNKPLQAIGLVSGALVALVYWGAAVGTWLVKREHP